jgi:CHAT domain-containing protein
MNKIYISFLFSALLILCFSQQQQITDLPTQQRTYETASKLFEQAEKLSVIAETDDKVTPKAEAKYREAIQGFDLLIKGAGNSLNDSIAFFTYLKKGFSEFYLDNPEIALRDYLSAIAIRKKTPYINDSFLFIPLLYTGAIYYSRLQYDSASFYYKNAEKINARFEKPLTESQRLYNRLGVMHYETGNYRQAKNYFEKAIEVQSGDKKASNSLLINYKINIASLQVKLEEYKEASQLYENLLPSTDYANEIHHNLGIIYLKTNEYNKSLDYLRKVNYQDNRKLIELYYNFAMVWSGLNQPDSSEVYYLKANAENLKFNGQRKNVSRGLLLKFKGDEYNRKQLFKEAAEFYQQAIIQFSIDYNETDVASNPVEFTNAFSYINLFVALTAKADALNKLYQAGKVQNNLVASLNAYDAAFKLADYVSNMYDSDESRLFLSNIKYTVHSKPIEICLSLYEKTRDKQYIEKAWIFDQQNKASILSQNIRESEWRNEANITDDLLQREALLKNNHTRLSIKAAAISDSLQLSQLKTTIRDNELELSKLREEINENPTWNERRGLHEIPSIAGIQKKLDNTTALLSYHLSETDLLILMITGNQFSYHTEPIGNTFLTEIGNYKQSLYNPQPASKYSGTPPAMNLYKILIGPFQSKLTTIKRLVIIPDDELNYLPFDALQDQNKNYLIQHFAVTYQFTAALFNRKGNENFGHGILSFAPFSKDGFLDTTGNNYTNLPASLEEINNLKGKSYTAAQATKNNFLQEALHYRTIHLATHASVDDKDPKMSHIVFHPSGNDFKLYAREIYNLRLDSTELIILSACETGTGHLIKGEGLMSLSRAFAYAGCRNIITSLWKASDKTTAYIMSRLHLYLEEGMSRDMALQQAKSDLLRNNEIEPRYKSPEYWAHLILIGNYEPYHKTNNWWWIAIILIAGALIYKFLLKGKSLLEKKKA